MLVEKHEEYLVAEIKSFWNQYSYWIIGFLFSLFASVSFFSYRTYRAQQFQYMSAEHLQTVLTAQESHDRDTILKTVKMMQAHYPGIIFTSMASMILVKDYVANHQLSDAFSTLKWIEAHSPIKSFVQLSLFKQAQILAEEKKNEEALNVLESIHDQSLYVLTQELQGDVCAELGHKEKSVEIYKKLLERDDLDPYTSALIISKLQYLNQNS